MVYTRSEGCSDGHCRCVQFLPLTVMLSVPKSQVDAGWEAEAKRVLKAELARHGVSYKVLAVRLQSMGVADNEKAIANRISRGKFSFAFFLQCMAALGTREVILKSSGEYRSL